MQQPITIRNLGPDEVHVLDRVADGVFDNPVDPTQAFRFLATRVNEIVVALSGGEVVGMATGCVLMHPDKPFGFFVNEVGVADDYRRKGIATRMLTRLLDLARDRGCEEIWLATEGDNKAARALYRKFNTEETEDIVMYTFKD